MNIKNDIKWKVISINFSYDCAKTKRCKNCYFELAQKIKGSKTSPKIWESWIFSVFQNTEQVALSYNGKDFVTFIEILDRVNHYNVGAKVNITTRPEFLTDGKIAYFGKNKVNSITLSLDIPILKKKNLNDFNSCIDKIKKVGMVPCVSILMFDNSWSTINKVLPLLSKNIKQIHLLRPKYYTTKISKEKRSSMLFLLKQVDKRIFVDQCFNFELNGIPCTRGSDFVSINPDASVSLCSFDFKRENKFHLTKCPFI